MAPIIHFVRHAQGYHNLSVKNHSMPDPSLTSLGEEQCRQLSQKFPYHDSVDLLVASPLRRTIYTALLGFKPEIERGLTIIALPEVQETAAVPCDTGSDVGVLREEMKGKPIDLSRIPEGWNSKTGEWAPTQAALESRARKARQWLRARPEQEIVLVTHGGLLHYLTEDWTDYKKIMGTGWTNVEFRSYSFAVEEGDNARIIETQRSKELRQGTEKLLTKAERIQLQETVKRTEEDGGYHPLQAKV